MLPICSGHFKKQELQESYTIGDFRATLPQETYVNVFVELQKDQKFDAIVDVILMKKVQYLNLYTKYSRIKALLK